MNNNHSEEVINHSIDNQLTFFESYRAIIDKKLDEIDKNLHDLRRDIEFTMEEAQFSK